MNLPSDVRLRTRQHLLRSQDPRMIDAIKATLKGLGWEDVALMPGINKTLARALVLGVTTPSGIEKPDSFGRVFSGPTTTVAVELRDAP